MKTFSSNLFKHRQKYFRNIHTKAVTHADPAKAQLEDEKLARDRQRARRATVSFAC